MTVAKDVLNNGEHTLISVMAKMIYSAVWVSERFVLKDSRLLNMVKLVGAVRNFHEYAKYIQIDVKEGNTHSLHTNLLHSISRKIGHVI
jgi:hypothetical protein